MEVEEIIFGVNVMWRGVAGEESVEVIIWAICKSKKKLKQMPKAFCKSGIEKETTKFKGEVYIPAILNMLIFKFSQRTLVVGFRVCWGVVEV